MPPRRPPTVRRSLFAAAGLALLAAACGPALDWRLVQPPGWSLAATLPCRPDTTERRVPLAGAPVALGLWSCQAGDHMFAIASADLGDPARVGPALQALGAAARANIGAQLQSEQPAQVPGMTPHPDARLQRLVGRRPDGQPVRSQVLVFAYGARVYQATVLGPQAGDAQARPLFESLGVRP
ncbi:hypothetical protein AACH10_05345 [Ideonella sp. DXS22W]|uniref:DUF1795 domain-containing protein n=1 Tax=Pseudaquabacterium inlustre TaxID=2984192 RepID=A0ABU9CGN2_9BURK